MKSSLGFHTLSLSISLLKEQTDELFKDIKTYNKTRQGNPPLFLYPENPDKSQDIWVIGFKDKLDHGIKWKLYEDVILYNEGLEGYVVEVTVNPKILSGVKDYITAATFFDMNVAIAKFNQISKSISPQLSDFRSYRLRRIDYCLNFDIEELLGISNPNIAINLIKRSNIPYPFHEWGDYNDIAHRWKSAPDSFYLINDSVNINCYKKEVILKEHLQQNPSFSHDTHLQEQLSQSKDIIRFEVQCKPKKVLYMNRYSRKAGNTNINKFEEYLSPVTCEQMIRNYFKQTVGFGDWYSLPAARRKVKSFRFRKQKADRLIATLELVATHRDISRAKQFIANTDLKAFNKSLNELHRLGINPVTIPINWNISHLPNLMKSYDRLKNLESINLSDIKQGIKEFGPGLIEF